MEKLNEINNSHSFGGGVLLLTIYHLNHKNTRLGLGFCDFFVFE